MDATAANRKPIPPWIAAQEAVDAMKALYAPTPYALHPGVLVRTASLDDLAMIWPRDGAVVIAFAGTRNTAQWVNNLHRLGGMHYTTDGLGMHGGAWKTMCEMHLLISEAIRQIGRGMPLRIVKHSRGGLLGPEWIRREGYKFRIQCVTSLGSPRVGNAAFVKAVETIAGPDCKFYRITHNNDPVPWVPPSVRGYRHLGEHWHLDRKGRAYKGGLGFARGLWDGLAGRTASAWHGVAMDGVGDHRIDSGYKPAVAKWVAANVL
jgi:hypothetical protein